MKSGCQSRPSPSPLLGLGRNFTFFLCKILVNMRSTYMSPLVDIQVCVVFFFRAIGVAGSDTPQRELDSQTTLLEDGEFIGLRSAWGYHHHAGARFG